MSTTKLSKDQRSLVKTKSATKNTIWLEGPAGTGKTTTSVHRMLDLIERGVDASSILLLVPQRTLAQPYVEALQKAPPGGEVEIMTISRLARRMIEFFWPLVSQYFGEPDKPPVFLNSENAQYYMARLAAPLIDGRGFFETLTLERPRLYSQMLDALGKSATVGFAPTEIAERLKSAWIGEESQRRVYDELQICINTFRDYCVAHNLLDFSLQIEVFMRALWPLPECRNHLIARYQHLIADNMEEDTPATHALLAEWLPKCESALVVYDTEAGYRRFLGSDPDNALSLKKLCKRKETFTDTFVTSIDLQAFADQIALSLEQPVAAGIGDPKAPLIYDDHRFQPQMIAWTAEQVARLVHGEGVSPSEIVILAPYMSDALRFSLMARLGEQEVPARSHRPSRSLREESSVQAMLTLAELAHPEWQSRPEPFDVAYALMTALNGLDLVRAQLLTQIVYRIRDGQPLLNPFDQLTPEVQERITNPLGARYDRLRIWLEAYAIDKQYADAEIPLDHFFARLFGEILAQPGYGFHDTTRLDPARQAANLIDSAKGFRSVVGQNGIRSDKTRPVGAEYIATVKAGLIANQYTRGWEWETLPPPPPPPPGKRKSRKAAPPVVTPDDSAVLIAPAYSFLMRNQPVDYQFWLNVGGAGWAERIYQPLTHPYVLSAQWPEGMVWTDDNETAVGRDSLLRLTLGLVRRCRKAIYLGYSELGEQGGEERGELLGAIQRMMRRLSPVEDNEALFEE